MVDTFNPPIPPQEEPTINVDFAVSDVRFGEGYIASYVEGMNTLKDDWPLVWVGTNAEIDPIKAFFDAHPGVSFYWTPPWSGAVVGRYRVVKYQYIPAAAGNAKINATLERFFYP